jgi:hypothetical protein
MMKLVATAGRQTSLRRNSGGHIRNQTSGRGASSRSKQVAITAGRVVVIGRTVRRATRSYARTYESHLIG